MVEARGSSPPLSLSAKEVLDSVRFRNPFSNPGELRPTRKAHTRAFALLATVSRIIRFSVCTYLYTYTKRGQTWFSRVRLLSLVCVRNVPLKKPNTRVRLSVIFDNILGVMRFLIDKYVFFFLSS